MNAEIMYSVADTEFISQAAIMYKEPVKATWPLDQMNAALAAMYTAQMELPWIYPVTDRHGVVGYMLMSYNERRSDEYIEHLFWDTLGLHGLVDISQKYFLVDTPCWAYTDKLGEPMAAVGYTAPYGPPLPLDPINDAIYNLMSQGTWPPNACVYLYPIRKEGDPLFSGIWIAECIDGLEENELLDDVMFKEIREQNVRIKKPRNKTFQRKRYDL